MKIPDYLKHVKPGRRVIREAKKQLKDGKKIAAIKTILHCKNNKEFNFRMVGGYESFDRVWGLRDSKNFVEQVLMEKDQG